MRLTAEKRIPHVRQYAEIRVTYIRHTAVKPVSPLKELENAEGQKVPLWKNEL